MQIPPSLPPTGPSFPQMGNDDIKQQVKDELNSLLDQIEEIKKSGGEPSPREKVRLIKLCERVYDLVADHFPVLESTAASLKEAANAVTADSGFYLDQLKSFSYGILDRL